MTRIKEYKYWSILQIVRICRQKTGGQTISYMMNFPIEENVVKTWIFTLFYVPFL